MALRVGLEMEAFPSRLCFRSSGARLSVRAHSGALLYSLRKSITTSAGRRKGEGNSQIGVSGPLN